MEGPRFYGLNHALGGSRARGRQPEVMFSTYIESTSLGGRAYLAFTVGPEVRNHADDVVKTSIRALIYQEGDEGTERVDDQAGFD